MRLHLPILFVLVLSAALAAEPAPAPKGEAGSERAQKLLESMSASPADEAARAADRRQRAAEHAAVGKRLHEARLYAEARQELDLAVRLDPANQEAKQLLELTEAMLAVRRSRIESAVQQVEKKEIIERQEQLNELKNHIDRARVLFGSATAGKELSRNGTVLSDQLKQLEEADRQLARAREIVKWMDVRVSVKDEETAIETLQDHVFKEIKKRQLALDEIGRAVAADEALRQREREQAFLDRQVRMLMDKAEMLYASRDYDEAARLCRRVKDLDPTNTAAVELETACRWKAIAKRAERTADLKSEAVKDWVEISGMAMIPHSQLLVYPKDWPEIRLRESAEEKNLQDPEWKKEIRAALEKEVSLEFVDQPLEECIRFLQGMTTVNIIPDPAAFAAGGPSAQQKITLRLNNTKLGLALKWILKMARLDYTLKNGAIFISTPDKLTGELIQKVYEVRDLTYPVPNFQGPSLGLGGGTALGTGASTTGGGGAAVGVVLTPPPPEVSITPPGALMDIIKKIVQPASWGVNGTAIEEKDNKLIVFHQPEVQAQISQLLEDFRKSQVLQVHVEARYLDVRQGLLEEIGVDWGGTPGVLWQAPSAGYPAPTTATNFDTFHPTLPAGVPGYFDSTRDVPNSTTGVLDTLMASWYTHRGTGSDLSNLFSGAPGAEGLSMLWTWMGNFHVQALLRAVQKDANSNILFVPRLTMYNNQRAYVFVGIQKTYVSGVTTGGTTLIPQVSTAIWDGVVLDVRPIVSYDRRYITLELLPQLVRPSTPRQGAFASSGTIIPYLMPVLELRRIQTVVTLPDGGTILLSGLMTERDNAQRQGIPFLMDLPVLGRFFANDFKDIERRNLLILVNAKLILFSEEEQKL